MMTMTIMMCNEFQIIDPRWQHRLIFITRLAALAKMVAPVMMMTMMMMVMMVMIVIMKKHTNKISTDTLSAHRQKYNITRFTKDSYNIYILDGQLSEDNSDQQISCQRLIINRCLCS